MADGRGLPLLSGPPPSPRTDRAEIACRKCNKEFNLIFTRSRKCNHCGYSYCSSCADYQALMPRSGPQGAGYDVMSVCAYCIDHLNITAAPRSKLKAMPLSKLRKYIAAYNIKADGAVEKDHLIDIILDKKERNGCLPRANEEYYRKYSVPYVASPPRGLFSRIAEELNPSSSISGSHEHTARPPPPRQQPQPTFARPDLEPDHPHPQPRFAPPPGPPPPPRQPQPRYHPHPYPQPPRAAPQPQAQPPRRPASTSRSDNLAAPPPQRQRAASSSSPPVRVPPLEELLDYDNPAVGALSISTLKAILFANHVPVHAGMVLEKGELVARVLRLIQDERDEIERKRLADEQEELERRRREEEQIAQDRAAREEWRRREQEKEKQAQGEKAEGSGQAKPPPAAATAERAGLCVICQDEEANIVAMDCGHLAMCRACSELIMHSSRECPLCRTRIVTEQRLLRVFKS